MAVKDDSVEPTTGSASQERSSAVNSSTCDAAGDGDNSLELAEDLMERGVKAAKEGDYSEAADCYSRALEIRVAQYGELAPECVHTYYKYGCVLLYKAQEEADPIGAMPKKDGESHLDASDKDGSMKNGFGGESSVASSFSNTEENGSSKLPEVAPEEASGGKDEEDGEETDEEELAEADEDESDLDLAWKMLDLARAIIEKNPGDTTEKVDILSALAEVALEREDVETSLSDYLKALAILKRLVEPDNRRIAELNFRICLCLEIGSKAEEAVPYCQTALSICKSRVQRLKNELKSPTGSTSAASEVDQTIKLSNGSISNNDAVEKEEEIKTLNELSSELTKKLEDLQQLVANPTPALSHFLAMMSAKAGAGGSNLLPGMKSSQLGVASSSGDVGSPTVSTAHTNGVTPVTHLGVVGRGVKRVVMSSVASEPMPTKKIELDQMSAKDDGNGP